MAYRVILCVVLGILAMSALPQDARADLISYTEPADCSDSLTTPSYLGTFDLGVNTVTGTIGTWDFVLQSWDHYDVWSATLAQGHEITGITLTITNLIGYAVDCYLQPPQLTQSHGTRIGNGVLDMTGELTAAELRSDGIWTFWLHEPLITSWYGSYTETYAYTWTITVGESDPTPEPGTIVLFGLGVAGLAWKIGRRPRRA